MPANSYILLPARAPVTWLHQKRAADAAMRSMSSGAS
jgi:hypothetical protein